MKLSTALFPKWNCRFTGGLMLALMLAVLPSFASETLVKQIEQTLSGVQRRIPTEPSRAEENLMEAQQMLEILTRDAPEHAKLASLEQQLESLKVRLERRLGRPVGQAQLEAALPEPVVPQTAATKESTLPGAVALSFKQIHTMLDAVEKAIESGQVQTAGTRLGQAVKQLEETERRHGSRIPDGNADALAMREHLASVTEKYNVALAESQASARLAEGQKEQREQLSKFWLDRFFPLFDTKSDLYLAFGSTFNSASEEQQTVFRKAYVKADDLWREYQQTEFVHGKTQELLYRESQVGDLIKSYRSDQERDRQAEACRPWVERLRAYVDVGAGSPSYLIDSIVLNEIDIRNRTVLLQEAQKCWQEYQTAVFPFGKTDALIDLERRMLSRIESMPLALERSRLLMSGEVEQEFDRVLAELNADTGWKRDVSKKPNLVMARDVDALQQALDRYATTVSKNDERLGALRAKLLQIREQDARNRAVRAERTFMSAERYNSDDADFLREKAGRIVTEKSDATVILRSTLPAERWMEESVFEWTDTTRTQRRHRITRYMTAQVAAKSRDGKVYLHGVYLGADRQKDGSWGPLYGNIQWSDWMAEANVEQH